VETVKGYLIFKSAKSQAGLFDPREKMSASLIDGIAKESDGVKEPLLAEFDYEDLDRDGIYTAEIASPAVSGQYEIRTVMNYKNKKLEPKQISMVLVVDPEGYVFEKTLDKRQIRIEGAIVSLFWLNPETKRYELWPAKDFQQQNPQTTDQTGNYSFLAPVGQYYLEVKAKDYYDFKGDLFQLSSGSGVHANIELKAKKWWHKAFSLERIMMGAIILLLVLILASLVYIIFRKKHQ
jgi:hypothetical protein